jgi:hypothetical protein
MITLSRRRQPEAQLQRAVLDHLAWRAVPGAWWCHYPAGGWRSPIEAAILKSLGTIAGVPDLLIVHRGQLYALELKTEYGRLTQTQIDTQARMLAAGATVATTVEIDAAIEQLTTWGLLRPDVSNQTARAFQQLRRGVAARRGDRHSSPQRATEAQK